MRLPRERHVLLPRDSRQDQQPSLGGLVQKPERRRRKGANRVSSRGPDSDEIAVDLTRGPVLALSLLGERAKPLLHGAFVARRKEISLPPGLWPAARDPPPRPAREGRNRLSVELGALPFTTAKRVGDPSNSPARPTIPKPPSGTGPHPPASNSNAVGRRRSVFSALARLIRSVIESDLTSRQRDVLFCELNGMPQEEIARQLGTNRNNVYKLFHDARKALKRALEARGYDRHVLLGGGRAA